MKLEIINLTKKYKDLVALNNINITLENGIYGLLGPNGSGKSTFMNILCMILEPTIWGIYFNNTNIKELNTEFLQAIGYMPQYATLYEDFTLEEYLYYIAALKGLSKKKLSNIVNDILCEVSLNKVKNRKIKTFSGGMKQRAMLAQALLGDPQILILDEPTAGLDPKKRIEIRNLIAKLSKDKIVIIATHVVSDIEFIAKEIILIKEGKLIVKETIQNLLKTVDGKVLEIEIDDTDIEEVGKKYSVSNIHYIDNKLFARILVRDDSIVGEKVYPTMDDVYLYYFGDEK